MEYCTRREFLKLAAGAGAGLLAGMLPGIGRVSFAAQEGYRAAARGAFIRFREPGLLTVRALSLEPAVRIQFDSGAAKIIKIRFINVNARRLELTGDGLERLSAGDTFVEAKLTAPKSGTAVIDTKYAPLPGERFNFTAFSDTHLGDPEAEEHFARVKYHMNLRRPLFAVDAGDIIDVDEPVQWDIFEQRTTDLKFPLFTTIGNHDSYLSTKLYREHLGDLYYSFIHDGVQILLLDNSQKYNNATLYMDGKNPDEQWDWLEEQLRAPAKHRIAFFHFPIYGNRSMLDPQYIPFTTPEDREREVERLVKLFKDSGVEYICFGHLHNADRKVLDGTVHLQLGGGGGSRPSHTDDRNVNFAHFFADENGVRDYITHLYYEPGEIERIEYCEARGALPVGAIEPIIVHGIAGNRRLAIEPELKIISGPGAIENSVIFHASAPGKTVIRAGFENFSVEHTVEIS